MAQSSTWTVTYIAAIDINKLQLTPFLHPSSLFPVCSAYLCGNFLNTITLVVLVHGIAWNRVGKWKPRVVAVAYWIVSDHHVQYRVWPLIVVRGQTTIQQYLKASLVTLILFFGHLHNWSLVQLFPADLVNDCFSLTHPRMSRRQGGETLNPNCFN